ncbi:uncharacterized protein LOC110230653 [Arabidopsis lyrata subsp. lyrata]|uniref:uncharacterized protein LOC110230653 n=1 Tax=Arabidopsis lyrata subsp. lyrata TaxID=81972 RepID=UPI000A29E29A|nr:uncharacterized protein LOC110230653 [Arabidopsis lyrata subsp. lyrata]|eukprot:XP_020889795.1 uncharacterized protein LOC110230653 [Arabidopsis lyrata subsp. lyrata]
MATLVSSDAAWDAVTLRAGLGWSFRSNTDVTTINETCGSTTRTHVNSALEAEAWAIWEALTQAKSDGIQEIHALSDCQTLVKLLNSSALHTEIQSIIDDIRALRSSFKLFMFSFIPRCSNSKADALAKNALQAIVPNHVP